MFSDANSDGCAFQVVYDASGEPRPPGWPMETEYLLLGFSGDEVSTLRVRYRGDADGHITLFWFNENGDVGVLPAPAGYVNGSGFVEAEFDLSTDPLWVGHTITMLTLELIDAPGASTWVDWIRAGDQVDLPGDVTCPNPPTTTSTTTTTITTTTTLPSSLLCSMSPQPNCNAAAQAKLDINEKKTGKEKMKLQWKKLAGATTQLGFGDPVAGTTAVTLCIYNDGDGLVEEYIVDRAGDQCAGKDCWKAKGTKGYGYKDKDNFADGISKLSFKTGAAGGGKADAKGKNNAAKSQNSLPVGVVTKLNGNIAPRIQMLTSNNFCVSATMTDVKKDDATRYSAQLK